MRTRTARSTPTASLHSNARNPLRSYAEPGSALHSMNQVKLIIEDGTFIEGESSGAFTSAAGEVVSSTAMTGCPENLTAPSFATPLSTTFFLLI